MGRRTLAWGAVLVLVGLAYGAPLLRGQTPAAAPGSPASAVTSVPGTLTPPAPGAASQPAIAVTSVPSPVSPENPTDQIMWALAMSYAIKFLTQKGWVSVLTPASSARVKAAVGFLVAATTAAGIHFAVNGSPFDGHGASITITGLSFDVFKDVGFQWVSQQAWYDALVKKGLV